MAISVGLYARVHNRLMCLLQCVYYFSLHLIPEANPAILRTTHHLCIILPNKQQTLYCSSVFAILATRVSLTFRASLSAKNEAPKEEAKEMLLASIDLLRWRDNKTFVRIAHPRRSDSRARAKSLIPSHHLNAWKRLFVVVLGTDK